MSHCKLELDWISTHDRDLFLRAIIIQIEDEYENCLKEQKVGDYELTKEDYPVSVDIALKYLRKVHDYQSLLDYYNKTQQVYSYVNYSYILVR